MPDIQLGIHTVRSHGFKVVKVHMNDWLILLLLVAIEIMLNAIEPFHRFVSEEMMNDLKYPFREDTVPFWAVPVYSVSHGFLFYCSITSIFVLLTALLNYF